MSVSQPFPAPGPSLRAGLVAECRSALLDTLARWASEFGLRDPATQRVLVDAAGEAFDELAGLRDKKGFDMVRSLTASRISLVCEADLELSIALSDFARRLREDCGAELSRLHLRTVTLLTQTDADVEQNMVGPEAVAAGLRALSEFVCESLDDRLRLIERCETSIAPWLRQLYARLDARLAEAGVGPVSLTRPSSVGPVAAVAETVTLAAASPAPSPSTAMDPALAAAVADRVLAWLDERQGEAAGTLVPAAASAADVAGLLAPAQRAALEALDTAFAAFLTAPEFSPAARRLLARSRLPLLRFTLLDSGLLAQAEHPARRFIDALAAAAIRPSAHSPAGLQALDAVVSGLLADLGRDAAVFERALTALTAARPALGAALAAQQQPREGVLAREERREVALRLASRAVRGVLAGARSGPASDGAEQGAQASERAAAPLRAFLELRWVHVIARELYLRGERNPGWRAALARASELAATFDAAATGGAPVRLATELQAALGAGMAGLGWDAAAQAAALQTLLVAPDRAEPYRSPAENLVLRAVADAPGLRVVWQPGYVARERAPLPWVAALSPGDALRLVLPHEGWGEWEVAALGPARQMLLLLGMDGVSALAATQRALCTLGERGELLPADPAPVRLRLTAAP